MSSASDPDVPLRLADVRALLHSRLGGRPTRANFRTGTLTVCTMVPMRSVPHRVVCLVGLDDGVFPRTTSVDGDDALARRPLTGERDARSEDRQLLLDALLAAVDTVVVTYTGANEHTGAERPPAVPLGEILDATDRTTVTAVRDRVLVRHPLQSYDARNLEPGRLVGERPFSFDRAALAGAVAAAGPRTPPPPLLDGALPPRPPEDVSLADLKAFLTHPVRAFLRGRLDVSTPFEPDELSDAIPVELDALEVWQVGDRLLREVLAGRDPTAVMTAELLRGTLPPGLLGSRALAGVTEECQKLFTRTADLREGEPAVDRRRRRPRQRPPAHRHRRTGVRRPAVVSLGYSRLKPRSSGCSPGSTCSRCPPRSPTTAGPHTPSAGSVPVRRPARSARPARPPRGRLAARPGRAARRGARRGRCRCRWPRPPPGPRRTPARCRATTATPVGVARRAWTTDPHSDYGILGEDADAYHQRIYGDAVPVEVLIDAGLPAYAWRIWEPLLTGAERVGRYDHRDGRLRLCGPLPTGTTLLEASAGTGKTFTVAALVARYVAEGEARLDQMLVVTFGRAASQELRERVRAQLVQAERALGDDPTLAGEVRDSDLIRLLLDGDDGERRRAAPPGARRAGGVRRRDDRDDAPVLPIVLRSLGVAGDTDTGARLVEYLDDLIGEVVDDLYLRAFAYAEDDPVFDHAEALAIARDRGRRPPGRLEPAAEERSDPRPGAGWRSPTPCARRSTAASGGSASCPTTTCSASSPTPSPTTTPRRGSGCASAGRSCWSTSSRTPTRCSGRCSTARSPGHATMVLIGDPKQAIYAFRGGDVVTYLAAAKTATTQQTLDTQLPQRRALLARSRSCCAGAALGDEQIVVHDVDRPPRRARGWPGRPSRRRSASAWCAASSSDGAATPR